MRTRELAAIAAALAGAASCSFVVNDVSDFVGDGDASLDAPRPDGGDDGDSASALGVDLMARWAFDENAGTTARDDLRSHDGELQGATAWVPGPLPGNSALQFDLDSFVYVPKDDAIKIGETMTLAAWVKLDAGGDAQYIYSHAFVFALRLNGRRPQLTAETGYMTANYDVPVGEWVHLTVTFAQGVVVFYVGGVPIDNEAGTLVSGSVLGGGSEDNWKFGAVKIGNAVEASAGAIGAIDDVRLWRRVLRPAEVAALVK